MPALPAIGLRHRRHQYPFGAPSGGERGPLVERHPRVVPRKILRLSRCCGGLGGSGSDALAVAEEAGEKAVEPGTLQRRERRILGQEEGAMKPISVLDPGIPGEQAP